MTFGLPNAITHMMRPRPRRVPDEFERAGQALAIGEAILTMVLFGALWVLLQPYMTGMNEARKERVSEEAATQGMDWTYQIWQNFPFIVMAVLALGTIVIAVFRRRGI